MSCGGEKQNFRLLDGYVGWDEENCQGLTGLAFDDANGLMLAQQHSPKDCTAGDPFISVRDILQYIPPPQLAHGCEHCDWFLVYKNRLLHHDCCLPGWRSAWTKKCNQHKLKGAIAVAARGHHVAVSDRKAKRILIWTGDGEQLIASIDAKDLAGIPECDPHHVNKIYELGPLAFTPWNELLVADTKGHSIWRFSISGELYGLLSVAMPPQTVAGRINRLAVSNDCAIWLITGEDDQSLQLWRARRSDKAFEKAFVPDLQKAFKPIGLTAVNQQTGFCIEECGPEGIPVPKCFKWNGEPSLNPIESPAPPPRYLQGQLLTRAIDSDIPRCRWHRLRLEAEVPSGATLEVAVATDEPAPPGEESVPKGDRQLETIWRNFEAGVPHHLDWQVAPSGSLDFLINQPPGRLLYLRLRFRGNKFVSPIVRRIRLDFPRVTSLDLLPPVYRDNPEAEDFTERFLALFDASIADLDRAIERAPALLDAMGVPDGALPWLGRFLDLAFDPGWAPDLRRRVLRRLPELYRERGTVSGLTKTIETIFGVTPAIQELATERSWGSVGFDPKKRTDCSERDRLAVRNPARLGTTRLFGKSRARFRLNTSALNTAPLRSYGNPDHDPLLAQAYRLRVLIPALSSKSARQKLEQLVANQKPAHTVAAIRVGGDRFILGDTSAIGIDTVIAPLPRPILGKTGNVRLGRMSVVWHGVHGTPKGISVGQTSVIGTHRITA